MITTRSSAKKRRNKVAPVNTDVGTKNCRMTVGSFIYSTVSANQNKRFP
jgi:hypothetical protein